MLYCREVTITANSVFCVDKLHAHPWALGFEEATHSHTYMNFLSGWRWWWCAFFFPNPALILNTNESANGQAFSPSLNGCTCLKMHKRAKAFWRAIIHSRCQFFKVLTLPTQCQHSSLVAASKSTAKKQMWPKQWMIKVCFTDGWMRMSREEKNMKRSFALN